MTGFEYLQKRARIAYALPVFPLLPSVIALAITLLWTDPTNIIVQFCTTYWWLMLVMGGFASYLCTIVGVRLLFCPFCSFRLSDAGARPIQFLGNNSMVKFCPNCAAAFSKQVLRRSDT
jgi:hypothetical protein